MTQIDVGKQHAATAGEGGSTAADSAPAGGTAGARELVSVPILALRPGDSPRLRGEEQAHIARLAEIDQPLPPIIVDRRTMRVIDGVHRLMAASLKGQATIDVEFFDGSPEDAFLLGVRANIKHGLPLSQADRRAAALRILLSHPDLSDRSIAETTGLGTRAIAEMRRSTDGVPAVNARVGRDGKVRPLNNAERRMQVAELLTENPKASLRQVARIAGVSPATALDVRRRLTRGEPPVPSGAAAADPGEVKKKPAPVTALELDRSAPPPPGPVLEKLLRDPSLRHNEEGRRLLRMLQENAVGARKMPDILEAVPPHCLPLIMQIAQHNSQMWQGLAEELDKRVKIADPWPDRTSGSSA